MTRRILLRTDGGAAIGLGHLQRCLSLAEALRRSGALCFFEVFGDTGALERVTAAGFPASAAAQPGDAAATAAVAAEWECVACVVDSYLVGGGYRASLREKGLFVAAIDDVSEGDLGCDLIVSIGPHATARSYRATQGAKMLLGPSFAILRPEYWDAPVPDKRPRVRNVLVTSGGADPDGVLAQWIAAVDAVDDEFDVTAVVGPFFADPEAVHDAAASAARVVRVISSPPVMRPLQAAADLAVTAAGQTLYELAALGTPAVAVEIAQNQRPQLDAFAALGVVRDVGRAGDEDVAGRITAEVGGLCADPDARAAMSEAAKRTVDRRGALLVARELLAAVEGATR